MPNTGVKGKIINAATSQGYKGLKVTVVNFEPVFTEDEVLAKGETDANGEFTLTYSAELYNIWETERPPDLVVRVFNQYGRILHETKEVEKVTDPILTIPDITIHPTSVEGL